MGLTSSGGVTVQRKLPGLDPLPQLDSQLRVLGRRRIAVTAIDRVERSNRSDPAPAANNAARSWAITFLTAAMSAPPTET